MRLRVAITAAAAAACLWTASIATAAVGDYRLVTGIVAWPLQVAGERVIVIAGDDGMTHFAELAPAESFRNLRAGDRVTVVGREGFKPDQLLFAQLERREDAGSAPAALPTSLVTSTTVPDIRDSPDVVAGVVQAVEGRSLAVLTRSGSTVRVDVSGIDADIRTGLRPGDVVTILAPTRVSGLPIASGIVVDHAPSPSASPR